MVGPVILKTNNGWGYRSVLPTYPADRWTTIFVQTVGLMTHILHTAHSATSDSLSLSFLSLSFCAYYLFSVVSSISSFFKCSFSVLLVLGLPLVCLSVLCPYVDLSFCSLSTRIYVLHLNLFVLCLSICFLSLGSQSFYSLLAVSLSLCSLYFSLFFNFWVLFIFLSPVFLLSVFCLFIFCHSNLVCVSLSLSSLSLSTLSLLMNRVAPPSFAWYGTHAQTPSIR